MTIGERIKRRREELGLTQEELAKKCGYKSRSSINKIELSRDLPLNKVKLMADALLTTPSELMGWNEEVEVLQKQLVLEQMKLHELQADDTLTIEEKQKKLAILSERYMSLVRAIQDVTKPHNDMTMFLDGYGNKEISIEMDVKTTKALELYDLYQAAPDNIQEAINNLLRQ